MYQPQAPKYKVPNITLKLRSRGITILNPLTMKSVFEEAVGKSFSIGWYGPSKHPVLYKGQDLIKDFFPKKIKVENIQFSELERMGFIMISVIKKVIDKNRRFDIRVIYRLHPKDKEIPGNSSVITSMPDGIVSIQYSSKRNALRLIGKNAGIKGFSDWLEVK